MHKKIERAAAAEKCPAGSPAIGKNSGFWAGIRSFFTCRACEAKDLEIAYLRALIDKLLAAKGVAGVLEGPGEVEETEDEKLQRERESRGAQTYGEG